MEAGPRLRLRYALVSEFNLRKGKTRLDMRKHVPPTGCDRGELRPPSHFPAFLN